MSANAPPGSPAVVIEIRVRVMMRPFAVLALCGLAGEANAVNGLNAIGFGLESNAMAGADLAVARDAFALNTNPAGLAQVRGLDAQLHAAAARQLGIEHDDSFGPAASVTNDYIFLADAAVAGQPYGWPVTLGASFAATGGGG
jgi:long-chain fatty acid transport protein